MTNPTMECTALPAADSRAAADGEVAAPPGRRLEAPARYGAVFLVMMSNLLLELLLTRIFSATVWYHFAFMAVSIALFGTTVGAVAVHLWPRQFTPERLWKLAGRWALLYAASIVVCTVVQLRLNITFGMSWAELRTLAVLYLVIAIPFTLSGIFICLALLHGADNLGAVYCSDLLGAGVGCALFVPFMAYGDGPRAALLLGAMAAVGAALMASAAADRVTALAAVLGAGLCVAGFAGHWDRRALEVHWSRGEWDHYHAFERWNAFSRLLVDPLVKMPFGWGLSPRFRGDREPPAQKSLVIDGLATTVLTSFDGDFGKLQYLQWDVTALPYVVHPNGAALVIGVGGGRDILTALSFGARHVVGAEVNGDILDLLDGPFADFTGRLRQRPQVELVHDEGRSYVTRTAAKFDVIQASLVDTWAAAANGAYVLSENALYTQEAFRIFLEHLTPTGVFAVSRWYFDPQPGETLRLVSLAATALRQRGSEWPQNQLFLARSSTAAVSVATLLMARTPFAPEEIAALRQWCAAKGFEELLGPGQARSALLSQLTAPREPSAVVDAFALDLSAPTDDRPFFFNMLRLRDAFSRNRARADALLANADAVVTLAWLFVVVVMLSLLFIMVPLWLRRSRWSAPQRGAVRLLYFTSLGLGFILIELSQMQRLMIALGHPVYGLTVVLFSLLVSAGGGSLWSQRMLRRGAAGGWLRRVLFVVLLVALATAAGTALLGEALAAAPTWMRITVSGLLLVPLGFMLGMPLATGLGLSASDPPSYRALYWGVNGAASVCGSVLATMLALSFGITVAYGGGVLAYALCAALAALAFPEAGAAPVVTAS